MGTPAAVAAGRARRDAAIERSVNRVVAGTTHRERARRERLRSFVQGDPRSPLREVARRLHRS